MKLLQEENPVKKRKFETNIENLNKTVEAFKKEVQKNSIELRENRREYSQMLEGCFKKFQFMYDFNFIKTILNQYGEDIDNFPHFKNPDLKELLETDFSKDIICGLTAENLSKFQLHKKIQTEFLCYAFYEKLEEVQEFVRKNRGYSKHKAGYSRATDKEGFYEKKFGKQLRTEFEYRFQNQANPVNKKILLERKEASLRKLENSYHNAKEEFKRYLKRLRPEEGVNFLTNTLIDFEELRDGHLEKMKTRFKKKKNGIYDTRFKIVLNDRPDVLQAIEEIHLAKSNFVTEIIEFVNSRLEKYDSRYLNENNSEARNSQLTNNQIAILLKILGILEIMMIKRLANTILAKIVSALTGRDSSNLKKKIEKIRYMKIAEIRTAFPKDLEIVNGRLEEWGLDFLIEKNSVPVDF